MTFEKIIKELKRIDKGLHELGISDKQDRRIALNESWKILEYVNEEMIKKEMLNQGSTPELSVATESDQGGEDGKQNKQSL